MMEVIHSTPVSRIVEGKQPSTGEIVHRGRGEACETSFTPPTIIHHLHVSVSYMHADHKLLCHVVYIASIVSTRAITPSIVSTRATAEPITTHVCITLIILSISAAYDGQNPPHMQFPPLYAIQAIGLFCRLSSIVASLAAFLRQLYIQEVTPHA